jgi:UDP-N-acetylmuramyl tripeptide synthase
MRRPYRTNWRLAGAVLAGRGASALSRALGRGGGTVIAGHVVPRLAPHALARLSAALPDGVVLVSGTNGKTTTSRLLAQVLGAGGRRIVHNRAGANLLTGIVSALAQAADARLCPRCGAPLVYESSYYGHLGHYRCSACAFARPTPAVAAVPPLQLGPTESEITVHTPVGTLDLKLPLPGLYNVYNGLAATAGSLALGLTPAMVATGLARVSAAFGRLERIAIGDRAVSLALVKNPVGCTEVLRTLAADPAPKSLLVAINDLFADGTDVSWLWDADFELLSGHVATAVCSGTRAADMALRLKYALVESDRLLVESDVARALQKALARTPAGGTLHVLPTYTAMLALREALRRQGAVAAFWED